MRAGTLRRRVALQRLVAGSPQQTASGQPDEAWTTFATVDASIEPLSGRELFAAQEFHSEVTTRIRIRYRSGVHHAMRATYSGRVFDIHNVIDPQERHVELLLLCSEGTGQG